VTAILPEVNAATRTLKARVEIANPGARLVPGMFARVAFAPAARAPALVVPSEAIIRTGTRDLVMVARPEGKFVPVEVKLGTENGGSTEVREGLQAGDRVVVSGQFLVDSEASLKGVEARMRPREAAK
jgi:Cu(I)/Ag(I) efflux system membrane fusion protein